MISHCNHTFSQHWAMTSSDLPDARVIQRCGKNWLTELIQINGCQIKNCDWIYSTFSLSITYHHDGDHEEALWGYTHKQTGYRDWVYSENSDHLESTHYCNMWCDYMSTSNRFLAVCPYICIQEIYVRLCMTMSIPQYIILEIPDTLSQWEHIWFWLSIFGNSSEKLHCGNVVNMPYFWFPLTAQVSDTILY